MTKEEIEGFKQKVHDLFAEYWDIAWQEGAYRARGSEFAPDMSVHANDVVIRLTKLLNTLTEGTVEE